LSVKGVNITGTNFLSPPDEEVDAKDGLLKNVPIVDAPAINVLMKVRRD